jgi:predicted TIM-barrel enzyme
MLISFVDCARSIVGVVIEAVTKGDSMTDRAAWLNRWRASSAAGTPILGAGAGTGITAKCAEAAGADLIIIYNSGRYRMAGRGSLAGLMPYGDANAIVMEMAREVLPIVRQVPVLAGVCGTDPFRVMEVFLRELKELGFSGVQNFPTVGLIDGLFRENLEETGMGYALEVHMIARAHQMDLLTCPYVFDEEQAKDMTKAGADLLIAHMGLTTKGTIGARTAITLDESVARVQAIQEAAASIRREVLVLCHGGPIAEPSDVDYVLSRTRGVCGFFGASSIERLPTERAISEQVRGFKNLSLLKGERSKHG